MKAIVLDNKRGRAALLLEDGTTTYRRVKALPGSRIDVPDSAAKPYSFTKVLATAAAFALVVTGAGYYETKAPVSYVSVDVNPSLEYSLNRLDKVIDIQALNKDASSIVEELENNGVRGEDITNAMSDTKEILRSRNYLSDDTYMLISVTSSSKKHEGSVEKSLSTLMEQEKDDDVNYSILALDNSEREEAKKLNMSASRYHSLVAENGRNAASDKQTVESFKQKSVKDIIESDKYDKNSQRSGNIPPRDQNTDTGENTTEAAQSKESNDDSNNTTNKNRKQTNRSESAKTSDTASANPSSGDRKSKSSDDRQTERRNKRNQRNKNKSNNENKGSRGNRDTQSSQNRRNSGQNSNESSSNGASRTPDNNEKQNNEAQRPEENRNDQSPQQGREGQDQPNDNNGAFEKQPYDGGQPDNPMEK